MGQIFISYSRRDTEIVDQIADQMEDAGLDVWIDRGAIKAGDTWRVQIVEAIDTCLAFVLMLSPNSADSDNVRREIDLAQDAEGPFLPLMLEPVEIPREIRYQLAGQQFIDVQMLGFEKAVDQLIETIKDHLKKIQPAVDEATRQVELVIQGINLKDFTSEKQDQLLDFLAQLSNSDRSQLQLANLGAGSVRAFVDMPASSAYKIKTLALNTDKRFKQVGITCLRLQGEKRFVNTSFGVLSKTPTLSLLQTLWLKIPPLLRSTFGARVGKFLTILVAVFVLAGVGLAAPQIFGVPTIPIAISTTTPIATKTIKPTSTPTTLPTETFTPSPTITLTSAPTFPPTPTATITPVPTYQVLRGTVQLEYADGTLSCRYGPGEPYLYKYGLNHRARVEVGGQMEIRSGDQLAIWLYLPEGFQKPCWVNAKHIELDGDISSIEPDYYPDKTPLKLILFRHENFPPPKNVSAKREGNQVGIYWEGYTLEVGDREGPDRPVYLVEAWTCQDGNLVFTPIGAFEEIIQIIDEAGCSEASSGEVYVAHVDGYVGPVSIPWPPHPTSTP